MNDLSKPIRHPAPDTHAKPELLINTGDLPAAVNFATKLLTHTNRLFNHGGFLSVVHADSGGSVQIEPITHHGATMQLHAISRPAKFNEKDGVQDTTFPERAAKMLVDGDNVRNFPKLEGIAVGPLLSDDGRVRTVTGYDPVTRLWCMPHPRLSIPDRPSRGDAAAALARLRDAFATFPFADASRIKKYDLDLVDIDQHPGEAESAFLAGLLTAVCRPTLRLAPGLLVTAPAISGAGSGKGLLVQSIAAIAFGQGASAITAGTERAELEKRIESALMQAGPVFFLDNVNETTLRSATLASVLTERPYSTRPLGVTRMVELNGACWIAISGNGLSVSEDLARRFISCELDAQVDDAEAREFATGRDEFLADIKARRGELLSATLTILRWGRLSKGIMTNGRPMGSFEDWCRWVRDPLLTLGCRDPVAAIGKMKARDPHRLRVAEIFTAWWSAHGNQPIKLAALGEDARFIVDPQNRGRQYVAQFIGKLAGTRAGGYVLHRQDAVGGKNGATYMLREVT